MECLKCFGLLAKKEEVFFFVKGSNDVHLSIKPELLLFVKQNNSIDCVPESKKKTRVKCKLCYANVGVELPFGPNGTKFYAFGADKVKLCSRKLSKKDKWWNCYKEFSIIDNRDASNFFNVLDADVVSSKNEIKVISSKIQFPSITNLYDFEWSTVSLRKNPRQYQIHAFVESLQRHLIVVIKTGAGKTLIASMFIGRMCALNPERMGLMIVDRIPLVFQQGDSIQGDTNLRVARICGENRTEYKMRQINNGHYDVLVVTAGAFFEMVKKKKIDTNWFCAVVFDECHHMSGGHKYVNVLELFTQKPLNEQPRILGLTASPVSGKTLIQFQNQLEKFLQQFPFSTKIFCPELPKQEQKTEIVKVELSQEQQSFICDLTDHVNHLLKEIGSSTGIGKLELRLDLINTYQIIGDLRSLEGEYPNIPFLDRNIKKAFILIDALEVATLMGIPMAYEKIMKSNNIFSPQEDAMQTVRKFEKISSVSVRLSKLDRLLTGLKPKSKIIVFSHTRVIARQLKAYLQIKHSNMKIGIVVGHAGYDGMGWEGEQEDIIKDFRNGTYNLLVCTSVLEEGLDVPSCDVVIRYTGVKSLVQFIQSRGRGRMEGSRFVVYQSEAEASNGRNMEKEEEMLKLILRQKQNLHQCFSELSKEIVRAIEQEIPGIQTNENKDGTINIFQDNEASDFTFTLYVDPITDVSETDMKQRIFETIDELRDEIGFHITRIELKELRFSEESGIIGVLPENTLSFLVAARCQNSNDNFNQRYTQFCRVFEFQLHHDHQVSKIWSRRHAKTQTSDSNVSIPVQGFSLGHFTSRTSALVIDEFFQDTTVLFEAGKTISLLLTFNDIMYCIKIPFPSISNFALLSINNNNTFTVGFVLSYPPFLYLDDLYDARFDAENELVNRFSDKSAIFIHFQMNCLNEFRTTADTARLFPSLLFDVKLTFETRIRSQELKFHPGLRNILWMLRCIEDSKKICFSENLQRMILDHVTKLIDRRTTEETQEYISLMERLMERVHSNLDKYPYFCDFKNIYSTAYRVYCRVPIAQRNLLDTPIPKFHFLVKRIVVTPSKIIALPAVPVASNRLLRMQVADHQKLAIVSFKDEDMSKVKESTLFTRIRNVIINGVIVNDIKYYYLCSTGSQLRAHKGYFIATINYGQLLKVRQKIVPEPGQFTLAAKYLSRLGLYGTADKPAMDIAHEEICWVDDEKAINGELTTDGAGKVTARMAKTLYNNILEAEEEFLSSSPDETPYKIPKMADLRIPSCFQIRYSGCKGILVCTDQNDQTLQGREFAFRPSMKKFMNNDLQLSVVTVSKIYDLNLNREVITLLSCIKCEWPLNEILMRYQEEELQKHAEMFVISGIAIEALSMFLSKSKMQKFKLCGLEILEESYWFKLLQGVYRLNTNLVRRKTSIPLKNGCLLIGVPDPYGVLSEGEIFVQLNQADKMNKILDQPVLMFRNPCLHPGDIRRVKCVYKKELCSLYNVIVLPVKRCTYSLASACSGGDLDGDKFGVIWDTNLVPPEHCIFEPCDYASLTNTANELPSVDVTNQESLANFFIDFMRNDSLGRVAHKHLALCDILDDGARDPLAIKLSKSQSLAVDYPKTGLPVVVPTDALKIVNENGFPDFMEKEDVYVSKRILGEMYRRCKSVTYDFDVLDKKSEIKMIMNMNLILPSHDKYLEDAAQVYLSYAHNMEVIMAKFQLKVEADVILGRATYYWSEHLEADKGKATDAIVASYKAVVRKYRAIFFSNVSDSEEQKLKASAWYRIVNDPEIIINDIDSSKRFLSFPWVVDDVLYKIRSEQSRLQPSRINVTIGESALNLFKKSSSVLLKNITDKMKFLKDVEMAINKFTKSFYKNIKDAFLVTMYGSTSIYCCEPESDIDICIIPIVSKADKLVQNQKDFHNLSTVAQQKYYLQLIISPAIDCIVASKREVLGDNRKVPLIKCTSGDIDHQIDCDISMNEIGLRKTRYIHHLYEKDSIYLPLFWILVKWARISGLVKSLDDTDSAVMDTADFYALIINILGCPAQQDQREIMKPSRSAGIKYLHRKLDELSFEDYHNLGQMIYDFFRKAATVKGNMVLDWPTPLIPAVCLNESQVSMLARYASSAFHCISATRDVSTLQMYCLNTSNIKKEFAKKLSLSVSYAIGKALAFHETRLSQLTGASVTIKSVPGQPNLMLRGEGTQMAISRLRDEIRSLIHTNKALVLGRLPQKSSRYFMEGSSILIVQKDTTAESLLSFEDSNGAYELLHHANQRSGIYVKNDKNLDDEEDFDDWKDTQLQRLISHILNQLQKFPVNNDRLKQSLESSVRFGCFYLIDVYERIPDSQTTISIKELELASEKGRRSRKSWKRSEFKSNFDHDVNTDKTTSTPSFRMVNISSSSHSRSRSEKFSERVQTIRLRKKNIKRGVATAFTPGLLECNTRDDSVRDRLLKIYRRALTNNGFREGSIRNRRPPVWKVNLSPSSSYEVQLTLDDDLQLLTVTERTLHWVHATIISGNQKTFTNKIQNEPDIRINISSSDAVRENSDLYKSVIYQNNDKVYVPIEVKNGKPVISSRATPTAKKSLQSVRHCQKLEMYTNGTTDASIVYGDSYFGKNMDLNRPFCEVSLYCDPAKIHRVIDSYLNNELLEELVREMFDVTVKLQAAISDGVKNGVE